jgi:hypothetical protein
MDSGRPEAGSLGCERCAPSVSRRLAESARVKNSLCRGQERRTMRESEVMSACRSLARKRGTADSRASRHATGVRSGKDAQRGKWQLTKTDEI